MTSGDEALEAPAKRWKTWHKIGLVLLAIFSLAWFSVTVYFWVGVIHFVIILTPEKDPYYNIDKVLERIEYPKDNDFDVDRNSDLMVPSTMNSKIRAIDLESLRSKIISNADDNGQSCDSKLEDSITCFIDGVEVSLTEFGYSGEAYFRAEDSNKGKH